MHMPRHVQNCDMIGSLKSKLKQTSFSQDFSYELMNVCEMIPWMYARLHYAFHQK